MTKAITDAEFEAVVLKSSKPVVVDFWAEWCGPCKQIAPALEELSKEMGETVTITKMNVDENQSTPGKYNVRAIPTLLVFKDGKVVGNQVGVLPKKRLQDWINASIGGKV